MENKDKIVLDLCGGTGAWSRPYKEHGYDVHVITLPDYDLFETKCAKKKGGEIEGRWLYFHNRDKKEWEIIDANKVYGILAAPTCTHFSFARMHAKTPRDLEGAMELVKKCLEIIWFCRASNESGLKFWALENPMGFLRQFLGKPPLKFSPEEYGENYTKTTDIWGYFNIPKAKYPQQVGKKKIPRINQDFVLQEIPEGYKMPSDLNKRQVRRSITSSKFAEAFYKANK